MHAAAKEAAQHMGENFGRCAANVQRNLFTCEIVSSSEQPTCEAHDLFAVPFAVCVCLVMLSMLDQPHGELSQFALAGRTPSLAEDTQG